MFKKVLGYCLDEQKWKKWTVVVLWSIFFYGMYLRMKLLLGQREGFWVDEHWQLNPMKGSFLQLLKQLPEREFCSYLSGDFYLIYPFFKMFGYDRLGVAIPHIIITILGFYLLYRIGRLLFKTPIGYIISFLVVSLNATMINHATEIRPYAVLPTLALACLYFSLELVNKGAAMSRRRKILIGIFFIVNLWFHLYGLFTLFFPMAFALSTKIGDRSFKRTLVYTIKYMSVVLCIAMPLWLYSVLGPHLPREGGIYGFSTFMFIPDPVKNGVGFLKGVFGNLVGYKGLYFLLGFIFMPFILPYKERFKQIAFLIILVFIPIGLLFALAFTHNYFFVQRQFIWVMPFFALYLGWVLESTIWWAGEKFS